MFSAPAMINIVDEDVFTPLPPEMLVVYVREVLGDSSFVLPSPEQRRLYDVWQLLVAASASSKMADHLELLAVRSPNDPRLEVVGSEAAVRRSRVEVALAEFASLTGFSFWQVQLLWRLFGAAGLRRPDLAWMRSRLELVAEVFAGD